MDHVPPQGPFDPISRREAEILRLIASGLSNEQIAQQLFLAVGTVKWYNKQIFSKLGAHRRTQAVAQARILGLIDPPPATTSTAVHNTGLPVQHTTFIGRSESLSGILSRLHDPACRLLTLVGEGGIGKSRLAIEAASRLADPFGHGIFFVPLAPLHAPSQIVSAIAEACQFRFHGPREDSRQLAAYLSGKRALFVVDNFEHLISGSWILSELLQTTRETKFLVTSRVALNLEEEWIFRVSEMEVPPSVVDDPEDYEAVQLFLERAARVRPEIDVHVEGASIARICRQTAGLPLALEIAASWTRVLSCEAIAAEIERTADFLVSPNSNVAERHKSMRTVFDSSWRLLTPNERDAFMKLSVFRGGFSRRAAQVVTGASLGLLAQLIDRSLVHVTEFDRYDIHPLLGYFGRERLDQSPESDAVRSLHSHYYLEMVARHLSALKGHEQVSAVQEIRTDLENIRTAWSYAVEHKQLALLDFVIEALVAYNRLSGELDDLFEMARKALEPRPGEEPTQIWCRVLTCGIFGVSEAQRALEIAEQSGETSAIAAAWYALGIALADRTDFLEAIEPLSQGLVLSEKLGDVYLTAWILTHLQWCLSSLGRSSEARAINLRALALFRQLGDRQGMATAINHAAYEAYESADFKSAIVLLLEAVDLERDLGMTEGLVIDLQFIGNIHFFQGNFDVAVKYYGEAEAIAGALGPYWLQLIAFTRGYRALMASDYRTATRLFEESRVVTGWNPFGLFLTDWGQTLADIGLEHFDTARERLCGILQFAIQQSALVSTTLTLPIAALLLAHVKYHREAVMSLGWAFYNVPQAAAWFNHMELGKTLTKSLIDTLATAAFDEAWAEGAKLPIETLTSKVFDPLDCR